MRTSSLPLQAAADGWCSVVGMRFSGYSQWALLRFTALVVDPGRQCCLGAGFCYGDWKETWFAEEWIGAAAWSWTFDQRADQRLEHCIVFTIVDSG